MIVEVKEEMNVEEAKKKRFFKSKKTLIFLVVMLVILASLTIVYLVSGWDQVKAIFSFISNHILGMKWLNNLVGIILKSLFGEDFINNRWGSSLQFFVYDCIKIMFLLCLLIFLISYIQSYFPPERTKKILGKYKGIGANGAGALLGSVTPFCSCSSIPLFIGFNSAGISSGVTFSFLISSPLIDIGALILLISVFGFPVALTYLLVGIVLAVIGGLIIEKTGMGKYIIDLGIEVDKAEGEVIELTRKDRIEFSKAQMISTFKKVWIYIIVGVGIGAAIHNFIPEEWIQAVLGSDKWYSVLVATFIGTPMYADIFGTIPVAQALFAKGVGIGTILAFMMSVTVMSLPSMVMLSKVVKPKLLITFITIVVSGIIIIGYVFNALNFLFI